MVGLLFAGITRPLFKKTVMPKSLTQVLLFGTSKWPDIDRNSGRLQLGIPGRITSESAGITANIFHMINNLAIDAIETGHEHIIGEMVENWEPKFDAEAAFA